MSNYKILQNYDELQDNNLGGFPDYAIGAINDEDNKSGVIMDSGGGGETKYAKCDNFTQPSDLVPYFSGKSDTIQYMHCADAYKGGGAFYCTAQENEKEEDKIQCCDGIDKGVVGYIIPPLVPGQDMPDGAVHPDDITKAQCVVPNVPIWTYSCEEGECIRVAEGGKYVTMQECKLNNPGSPDTCGQIKCGSAAPEGGKKRYIGPCGQRGISATRDFLYSGDVCWCAAAHDPKYIDDDKKRGVCDGWFGKDKEMSCSKGEKQPTMDMGMYINSDTIPGAPGNSSGFCCDCKDCGL